VPDASFTILYTATAISTLSMIRRNWQRPVKEHIRALQISRPVAQSGHSVRSGKLEGGEDFVDTE
jgi:hypothetical protein